MDFWPYGAEVAFPISLPARKKTKQRASPQRISLGTRTWGCLGKAFALSWLEKWKGLQDLWAESALLWCVWMGPGAMLGLLWQPWHEEESADGPQHWASISHRKVTHCSLQNYLGQESRDGPQEGLNLCLALGFCALCVFGCCLCLPRVCDGHVIPKGAQRSLSSLQEIPPPCQPPASPSTPVPIPTAAMPAQAPTGQPPVLSCY